MAPYDVQVADLPSRPLAVVRRQARGAELARVVPESCGVVWSFARAHGLRAGRNVAVYRDDAIRLEVGVEVDGPFAEGGGVVRSATPAGPAAFTVHLGPYHQLHAAHAAIHDWCRVHDHPLAGPRWEVYGHWQEEWDRDPSRIRTDVFYQLVGRQPPAGRRSPAP